MSIWRLRFARHVLRLPEYRPPSKAMKWAPKYGRRVRDTPQKSCSMTIMKNVHPKRSWRMYMYNI